MMFFFLGTLKLDLLELRANSHLTYPTNLNFELGELLMRYASVLEAEKFHLKSTFVYIEGDASINTAGRGPGAGLGKAPGVITSTSSYIGSGAGHGGYGGGADVVNFSNGMENPFKEKPQTVDTTTAKVNFMATPGY